ncbi:hypothetical protein [Marinoscillum furvescens]|nr:hypothetical protein [Marinoscillum furvescens]
MDNKLKLLGRSTGGKELPIIEFINENHSFGAVERAEKMGFKLNPDLYRIDRKIADGMVQEELDRLAQKRELDYFKDMAYHANISPVVLDLTPEEVFKDFKSIHDLLFAIWKTIPIAYRSKYKIPISDRLHFEYISECRQKFTPGQAPAFDNFLGVPFLILNHELR